MPALQDRPATLALEHFRPQPPQLSGSPLTSVSQPFAALPSQSPLPLGHAVHVVLLQYCDPLQALLQLPQCWLLLVVTVSQPSSVLGEAGWTQLPCPALHVESHAPPAQDRVATFVLEHFRPQTPQLSGSVLTLVSQPSSPAGCVGCVQLLYPAWQNESHLPSEHERVETWVPAHLRPQAPQLSGSNDTGVSQPLSAAGAVGVEQSP